MTKRDLLRIQDLSREEIDHLIERAGALKAGAKKFRTPPLQGKILTLLFEKPSTRTRVSFEAAILSLGGRAIYLSAEHTQLSRGEPIGDTAQILSRYCDGLILRTHSHSRLEEFALNSRVPVLNGLTDRFHPCQILADLFTIREALGNYQEVRVAYLGDGNNVANSWIEACGRIGFQLALAFPPGAEADREVLKETQDLYPDRIEVFPDPKSAVAGADVVYTDVWISMGQDKDEEQVRQTFAGFQVNAELMAAAKPGARFMHCLPAHRGGEVTDEVLAGPQSVVLTQAENRLHFQKALLEMFIR